MNSFVKRYQEVLANIEAAKSRCHDNRHLVTLVAVSKTKPISDIKELALCGQLDFGENYTAELLQKKADSNSFPLRWHFIGHLQSRKVKDIVGVCHLIHSVDSLELAREINKRAAQKNVSQNILLQVDLGHESTKSGIKEEALKQIVEGCEPLEHLSLLGLMIIPPFFEDPQKVRPYFKELKNIRDDINSQALTKLPLTELSMGMSHDYEVAIEEGATLVRVGQALFGKRDI
ncbi:MAG: hypothetical protein ACD_73C00068G0002 [uncultured bacterium]|nr:MAG: hypothetical protein ACD_73C00068G0002 [uncultured bacterium]